jgi:hypothetical protein
MPGLPVSTAGEPPQIRKSAVDPESLKKARDRVEKRLRNRIEPRPYQDDHHARTLELARKITRAKARRAEETVIDIKNEAVDDIMKKNQNDKSEKIEKQADEALLLNDIVGVQLHDGAQGPSAKALEPVQVPEPEPEPEPEMDPTVSDDMQIDASTDTDTDGQDAASAEPPVTHAEFVDSDASDDVQTETVVLETPEQFSIGATGEEPEYDGFDGADEAMEPEVTDPPPAYIAAASEGEARARFGAALRRILPFVAWLILFSGIVGAVLSWTTINNVEAGVSTPVTNSPNTLPLGLLLGFAYLATGALGFAFFWVSSLINRQLKDIQQQLTMHPITHIRKETATDLPDE